MSSIPYWTPRQRPREKRMSRTDTLRNRTRGRCAYCGDRVPASQMTRDHVVPKSRGGPTKTENLVCACQWCNQAKADMDVEVFRWIHFRGERFYIEVLEGMILGGD